MRRLSIKTSSSWFRFTGNRAVPFFVALLILLPLAVGLLPPSSSAHLNSPPPLGAIFQVTLNGFTVLHETRDNALETDGRFDEIRLMTNTYTFNPGGILVDKRSFKSAVICDGTFRDPDLLANSIPDLGSRRGFKGGDSFPTASPGTRLSPGAFSVNISDLPPLTLFEGRLVPGGNAVVIIPSIWEMDGSQELRTIYNDQLSNLSSSLGRSVAGILRGPTTDHNAALREGVTVGLGPLADSIFIGTGFLGLGDPKDRPIGMVKRGNKYVFVPKVLVLTFDAAEAIARSNGPAFGMTGVTYEDDADLQGYYILYLQVTRVGN